MSLPHFKSLIALAAVTLLNGPLLAQFGDDPDSKAKLANACAISGGGNAADYQSYASSLAVTLSYLSLDQQIEVIEGNATGSASDEEGEGSESSAGGEEEGDGSASTGGGGDDAGDEEGSGGSSPSGWGSGGGISSWFTSNSPVDSGKGNVFAVVLDASQKATAEVSFTDAAITESVISGEFSMVSTEKQKPTATAGTMTQSFDPAGKPIFRAEDNTPRENATVSFKNGKLTFGPDKENDPNKGGKK